MVGVFLYWKLWFLSLEREKSIHGLKKWLRVKMRGVWWQAVKFIQFLTLHFQNCKVALSHAAMGRWGNVAEIDVVIDILPFF